jgi:hypothetical protein
MTESKLKTFTSGPVISALHVLWSVLALAPAISAIYYRRICSLQLKWTTRSAFIVWTSMVVLGIGFYAYYYLH